MHYVSKHSYTCTYELMSGTGKARAKGPFTVKHRREMLLTPEAKDTLASKNRSKIIMSDNFKTSGYALTNVFKALTWLSTSSRSLLQTTVDASKEPSSVIL